MDDNLKAKLNNSVNENKRLTHLTDSESQTSASMLFKTYTTSISPNSPPTHYFWPAIVSNSQVCASSGQSPSSDNSSHQNDVMYPLRKKKRRANPIPAESKDEAYVFNKNHIFANIFIIIFLILSSHIVIGKEEKEITNQRSVRERFEELKNIKQMLE
jgi:hypothetical protein